MRTRPHPAPARRRLLAAIAAVASIVATFSSPTAAQASPETILQSSFYDYSGSTPLRDLKPGAVLKVRTVAYHLEGVPTPLEAVQILYRTTDAVDRPAVNVTSVVRPVVPVGTESKVVSYQSFYDSLNPADQPSVAIAGGASMGDQIANVETSLFATLLLAGYTIVVTDTEGQQADFAAGPEYGRATLDGLRAATRAPKAGITRTAPIGMLGYSGGAIATEWAAELAPSYAPGIARRLVGSAIGGVLVHPDHNLHYIDGSQIWAGVMPMALIGLARAYRVDLTPYMNAYGRQLNADLQKASIVDALGRYPGLTWADLARHKYRIPESVPAFVRIANRLIMSTGGTPTSPMFVGQGTGGDAEGTPGNKPGIGPGDGVMIAGDVRTLARRYCKRGVTVQYQEYAGLSHVGAAPAWVPEAYAWLMSRFAGVDAPSSCGSIPEGNPLRRVKRVPAG